MVDWCVDYTFIDSWSKKKVYHSARELPSKATIIKACENNEKHLGDTFLAKFRQVPDEFSIYVISDTASSAFPSWGDVSSDRPYWAQFAWDKADSVLAAFLEYISVVDTDYGPHYVRIKIASKEVSEARLAKEHKTGDHRRFILPKKVEDDETIKGEDDEKTKTEVDSSFSIPDTVRNSAEDSSTMCEDRPRSGASPGSIVLDPGPFAKDFGVPTSAQPSTITLKRLDPSYFKDSLGPEAEATKDDQTFSASNEAKTNGVAQSTPPCGHTTLQKWCWVCHMKSPFHVGAPPMPATTPAQRASADVAQVSSTVDSAQSPPTIVTQSPETPRDPPSQTSLTGQSAEEHRWAYYRESASSLEAELSQSAGTQPVRAKKQVAKTQPSELGNRRVQQALKAYTNLISTLTTLKVTGDGNALDIPPLQQLRDDVQTVIGASARDDGQSSETTPEAEEGRTPTVSGWSESSNDDYVDIPNPMQSQPLQRISTREYIDELIKSTTKSPVALKLLHIMQHEGVSPASSLGIKLLDVVHTLRTDVDSHRSELSQSSQSETDDTQSIASILAEDRKLAESKIDEMADMLKHIAIKVGVDLSAAQRGKNAEDVLRVEDQCSRCTKVRSALEGLPLSEHWYEMVQPKDEEPEAELPGRAEVETVPSEDGKSDFATPKVSLSQLLSSSRQLIDSVNAIDSPYRSADSLPPPSPVASPTASPEHLLERLRKRSTALADAVKQSRVSETAMDSARRQVDSVGRIAHHAAAAAPGLCNSQSLPAISESNNPLATSSHQQSRHSYGPSPSVEPASPLYSIASPAVAPGPVPTHCSPVYPINGWSHMSGSNPDTLPVHRHSHANGDYTALHYPGAYYHSHNLDQTQQGSIGNPAHLQARPAPAHHHQMYHRHFSTFHDQPDLMPSAHSLPYRYTHGPAFGNYPAAYQMGWGQQLPNLSPTGQQRPF
ncbi:hypothetical protein IAU59_003824 [Kwoniella sp. CBS 9459]